MSDDLPTTSDLTVAGDRDADAALEQIGPYTLLRPLGEGGRGVVYLAEQKTPVARRVALKVIKLGMDTREVGHAIRSRAAGARGDGSPGHRAGLRWRRDRRRPAVLCHGARPGRADHAVLRSRTPVDS